MNSQQAIRELRGHRAAHQGLAQALASLDASPSLGSLRSELDRTPVMPSAAALSAGVDARAFRAVAKPEVLRPIAHEAADDVLRRLAAGRR